MRRRVFIRPRSGFRGFAARRFFSNDARGLTSASFLKTPPSARFEAMAGACLTQDGPQSFFCNPAGLVLAPSGAVSASLAYESLLEGSYRTGTSIVRGSRDGAFAAGALYNNSSPGMEKYNAMGTSLGGFSAYDSAVGAAFARRYGMTDFGAGVKFVKSKLAEVSGTSMAFDAGFVFRDPGDADTEFSLAVRNLGSPLKLGSERAPLPLEFGGGLKWKYTPDFNLLLEARLPCDHSPYFIMAGEWFFSFAPRNSPKVPEQAGVTAADSAKKTPGKEKGTDKVRNVRSTKSLPAVKGQASVSAADSASGPRQASVTAADSARGRGNRSAVSPVANPRERVPPRQANVSGFFVRGGINLKNYSDLGALGAFAGGFGLRLGALEFDYAFVPYGELGSTHRTEISWRFR